MVVSLGALCGVTGAGAALAQEQDTTPPETTIDSGPSGTSASSTASFEFSSTEADATFECKLDGGEWATCVSPQEFTGFSNGDHTFSVRSIDNTPARNVDPTPATRTWTVDTVAPDTSITSGPSGTSASTASFEFSSTEPGSTFECKLDGEEFAPCSSPRELTGLSNGSHTFAVRATDEAGNPDASPVTRMWTVDAVAPDTSITSGPSGTSASTTASFEFSSTEPGSTFECKLGAGEFASCSSPKVLTELTDGQHTFSVRARDAVGNTDPSPATRTWTVSTSAPDTSPPETVISAGPSGTTTSSSATFEFFTFEAGSTFECKLDAGEFAPCSSPTVLTGLSDGSHTFSVRAKDAAGNIDPSPATRTWTVNLPVPDTTSPDTAISSGPSGTTQSRVASFEFFASETSTFECKLDGGQFAPCSSPKVFTDLADGPHTFSVRATDTAGNIDTSPATRTWTVDTTVPDTTPPDTLITFGPAGTTTSSTASFEFSSTEPGSGFECKLDAEDWSACSSPKAVEGLASGPHTFSVRAKDGAGNVDPSPATRTWAVDTVVVDTTPPDTSITSGPSGTITSNVASFEFSSTEPGSRFECKLDAGGWTPCSPPKVLTNLAEGRHTFSVRATDSARNTDSSAASRSFTVDAVPAAVPTPPQQAQPPALMSPFPIVRIVGRSTVRGSRIRILSVRAPSTARILVRCPRRKCSMRQAGRGRGMRRPVRFKRFERDLKAGTIIEVLVRPRRGIGKVTRFRIRRGRSPARVDLCLKPAARRGSACPDA